jgi:hypothetical protein
MNIIGLSFRNLTAGGYFKPDFSAPLCLFTGY